MLSKLYNEEGKSLQEIGNLFGVSRERIRQIMEGFNLTRGYNLCKRRPPRYESIEEYVNSRSPQKKEVANTLRKLINPLFCADCGSVNHLHIHHIQYPANSIKDLQVLCASCHYIKHRKGITRAKQIDIYTKYCRGETPLEIAKEYNITRNLVYKILDKVRSNRHTLKRSENLPIST